MNTMDPKQEGSATKVHKKYVMYQSNGSVEDANVGRCFFRELWEAIRQDYSESGHCYYVEDLARGRYEWIKVVELSLLYAMSISNQVPSLREANLPYLSYSWYGAMDNTDGTASDVREQARRLIEQKKKSRALGTGRSTGAPYGASYQDAEEEIPLQAGPKEDRQPYRQGQPGGEAVGGVELDETWSNLRKVLGMEEPSQEAEPPAEPPVPPCTPGRDPQASPTAPAPCAPQSDQPPVRPQTPSALPPQPDPEQQAREQEGHIRQLQALMRQERLAWDAQVADQPDQMLTQQLEQTRGDMVTAINGLKRDWGKTLEENFTQLQRLQQQQEQTMAQGIRCMQEQQHQLAGSLRRWQRSLYIANFKELANCYTQLYRIVIRQERQCAELEAEGQLRTADKELKESLTTFRRVFEKAMAPLNLFILVPKAGDPYDDVIHITEQQPGAAQPLTGATVAECVIPGVLHRPEDAEDPEDYDVICRATVRLNG